MYKATLRRLRENIVAVEKQYVLYILNVFVALVIQHGKRMRRNILSSVACLLGFSTLSHTWHNFHTKIY